MRKILLLTLAASLAATAPSMAQTAKRAAPKIDQAALERYQSYHPASTVDDYLGSVRFCTAYKQLALTYIARKAAKRPLGEVQRAARLETTKWAPDGDYEKQQTTESALVGLVQKIYDTDIKDKNAFVADAYSTCMDKGGYLL